MWELAAEDSALADLLTLGLTLEDEGDNKPPVFRPVKEKSQPTQGDDDYAHSVDFRHLRWFGETYSFTVNQVPVVKMLYEHWEKGTPDIGGETLLATVDQNNPPKRMSVLFLNHPAWKSLIVAGGTKGTYRFAEPPAKNS